MSEPGGTTALTYRTQPAIRTPNVGLLTGGSDKPYALGLAAALSSQDLKVDFIGSNELDCPQVHALAGLRFLNLRGDQRNDAGLARKVARIFAYYRRLVVYAALSDARVLHILWNNKFEIFDRTLLMMYYLLVGKRVVLTAHNVNAAERDARDTWLNRASLRVQYRLCDHVFVHTDAMMKQLVADFGVSPERVSVIPFGINDTIPTSGLTREEARERLGLLPTDKTLLFFGQIAPYKGLEYLVRAVGILAKGGDDVRVVVAGKIKRGHEGYWARIQQQIVDEGIDRLMIQRIQFIPDEEVEQYFKAADGVALPYVNIFQSGVPFLAFSFGLPVIATDVGSLKEDIVDATGLMCQPEDAEDLARVITRFFQSELHRDHEQRRERIRQVTAKKHSWAVVGELTKTVYATLSR